MINVGIREQLLVSVGGGLALTGMRPIVHTFAPFLVERPFEQVKLDLGHQGVGACWSASAASYDWPDGGRTHQAPGDVALLDTLAGLDRARARPPRRGGDAAARARSPTGGRGLRPAVEHAANAAAVPVDGRRLARRAARDRAAPSSRSGRCWTRSWPRPSGLDVTVAYTRRCGRSTAAALRGGLGRADVVLVEPYLAGTSAAAGGATRCRRAAPAAGARRGPGRAAPVRDDRRARRGPTGWTRPASGQRSSAFLDLPRPRAA